MYCAYCGKELTGESSYCKNCGADIPEETILAIELEKRSITQRVFSSIRSAVDSVNIPERSGSIRIPGNNDTAVKINGSKNGVRTTLTTGCKVWFWFVLIVNALVLFWFLCLKMSKYSYFIPLSGTGALCSAALSTGAGVILFKRQKAGFYIIVGAAVISFLSNLSGSSNFILSLIGACLNPLISYYFVKGNADVLN